MYSIDTHPYIQLSLFLPPFLSISLSVSLSDIGKELDRKGGQDKLLSDLNGVSYCTYKLHVHVVCQYFIFILFLFSFQLYLISGSCCLLDRQLVQYCSEFYITHAVWLTMLLESCQKVQIVFSLLSLPLLIGRTFRRGSKVTTTKAILFHTRTWC